MFAVPRMAQFVLKNSPKRTQRRVAHAIIKVSSLRSPFPIMAPVPRLKGRPDKDLEIRKGCSWSIVGRTKGVD